MLYLLFMVLVILGVTGTLINEEAAHKLIKQQYQILLPNVKTRIIGKYDNVLLISDKHSIAAINTETGSFLYNDTLNEDLYMVEKFEQCVF